MEEKFHKQLVERYLGKRLNEEEMEVFFYLLNEGKLDAHLREIMDADLEDINEDEKLPKAKKTYRYLYPATIAAAILLVLFAGYFYNQYSNNPKAKLVQEEQLAAVTPGGNKAILTLSDGKKIVLNDAMDGMLGNTALLSIRKERDGLLVFDATTVQSDNMQEVEMGTHKIETPNGGIYQIILPDGSKAWLNSASSIEFPEQFAEHERSITIDGEIYFEIKEEQARPFKVFSNNQVIEVLGTTFNVNTYKDEPFTKTTLIEGSVKIRSGNRESILKPGEQSIVSDSGISVSAVDMHQVTAWQRGDFAFDGEELHNIMRQIGRWYDVGIIYNDQMANRRFGGSISRSKNIDEVLKVLAMTEDVNFKMEGRRVRIMP